MRKRTKAREMILRLFYQADITVVDPKDLLEASWVDYPEICEDPSLRAFVRELVTLFSGHRQEVDQILAAAATNWQLDRMAAVDRNILRLAAIELLFRQDVPPKVAINEAVELAKKYGDLESGKFVNGILDKVHKTR
ncbi:MAG: transcription antitermination factor NusB [Deltaproteobacteria bacterium]